MNDPIETVDLAFESAVAINSIKRIADAALLTIAIVDRQVTLYREKALASRKAKADK
jgi:hypothetical protein